MSEKDRQEFREMESDVRWGTKRTVKNWFWPIIGFFLAVSVLGFGISILSRPAQVIDRVLDPDRMIYNYEWFKQAYQDVGAIDRKIRTAQDTRASFTESAGDRSGWGFEDKQEAARLNTIVLGLQNQRADIVATYNARAQMATRSIFRTGELPETIKQEE